MNIMKNCHWGPLGLLLVLLFSSFTNLSGSSTEDSEIITTIILINRQAELVDVNSDGEVLKRHLAVPDYFSSGRSHNRSLKKSLSLLKSYGAVEEAPNHFLPNSSQLPGACLQRFMKDLIQEASYEEEHIANLSFDDEQRFVEDIPGAFMGMAKTIESGAYRRIEASPISRPNVDRRSFQVYITSIDKKGKQRMNYDRRLPRSGIYIT